MGYEVAVISLDGIFSFGKHKGKKVLEVLASNPTYIIWLYKTGRWDFDASLVTLLDDLHENSPEVWDSVKATVVKNSNSAVKNRPDEKALKETKRVIRSILESRSASAMLSGLTQERKCMWGSWQ